MLFYSGLIWKLQHFLAKSTDQDVTITNIQHLGIQADENVFFDFKSADASAIRNCFVNCLILLGIPLVCGTPFTLIYFYAHIRNKGGIFYECHTIIQKNNRKKSSFDALALREVYGIIYSAPEQELALADVFQTNQLTITRLSSSGNLSALLAIRRKIYLSLVRSKNGIEK